LNLLTGMLRRTGGTLASRGNAIDAAAGAGAVPLPVAPAASAAMTQSQFAGPAASQAAKLRAQQLLLQKLRERGDIP
jgi:hypothetical protein